LHFADFARSKPAFFARFKLLKYKPLHLFNFYRFLNGIFLAFFNGYRRHLAEVKGG